MRSNWPTHRVRADGLFCWRRMSQGEPKRGYGSRRRMEPAIAFIPRLSPPCTRRVWRNSRPSRPDRESCSYASRPPEDPKRSFCRSRGKWPKRCVRNTSTGISPFERRSSMRFQTIRARASTNSSFLALPSSPLGTRQHARRSPCGCRIRAINLRLCTFGQDLVEHLVQIIHGMAEPDDCRRRRR